MRKATVSRLTQTLTELGYLQYRGDLAKYELAPSVLALCHSYLGNMPVPGVARPAMLELARDEQVNVGLAIQDGLRMVYVEFGARRADERAAARGPERADPSQRDRPCVHRRHDA